MGISVTTGIASGIDYEEIIEATLDVERVKIDNYESKKEDYEAEISAFGEVKSALSSFQDALDGLADSWDFFEYSATSSDEDILTVSATHGAANGTYQIEIAQLAQAQRIRSDDVSITLGKTNAEALGLSGDFTINGETITVEADDTLKDIANAVNDVEAGVTASVLDGYLVLTRDETGDTDMSLSDGIGSVLQTLGIVTADGTTPKNELATSEDAEFYVNGVPITRTSNEIDDLIEGVTLNLHDETSGIFPFLPGDGVTVKVATDTEGMTEKAQALVDSYNSLIDLLDEYQDEGDEESYGILLGDATTNNLRAKLRNHLFSKVENGDSNITYLSNLGIQMKDDGHLSLDKDTFEEALAEDAEGVKSFFTTPDTGFADIINGTLDGYLSFDGIFKAKINGLESSVDRTQDKIDSLEDKLDVFEERLRARYAALETLLSELTGTQSSLTSLLSSLNANSSF